MTAAAHVAAALGGVDFVDLDTAWLLRDDPFVGGYQADIAETARFDGILYGEKFRGVLATLTPEEVNEDRLKFAGELSGESEEDLKKLHRSKPRNPLIADTCFKAGYIDSWGRGTIKIIEACQEAGLPEPILKEEQGGFLGKIFKDRFTKDKLKKLGLNDRQIEAVEYVKKSGKITNKEYQGILKVSRITATPDLTELVPKNILRSSETKGAGSFYILSIAT